MPKVPQIVSEGNVIDLLLLSQRKELHVNTEGEGLAQVPDQVPDQPNTLSPRNLACWNKDGPDVLTQSGWQR